MICPWLDCQCSAVRDFDERYYATERPVIDKTGLEGMFDFKLNWVQPRGTASTPSDGTIPSASDPADGSIFTAIEELGLKLESAKVPFEVLVIDSVQKPSEN